MIGYANYGYNIRCNFDWSRFLTRKKNSKEKYSDRNIQMKSLQFSQRGLFCRTLRGVIERLRRDANKSLSNEGKGMFS